MTIPAAERAALKWKRAGSIRPSNAWPGGPKRIPCLRCARPFRSRSRDERRCGTCKAAA